MISIADHHANIVPSILQVVGLGQRQLPLLLMQMHGFNVEQFKAHITPQTEIVLSRMSLMSWAQSSIMKLQPSA